MPRCLLGAAVLVGLLACEAGGAGGGTGGGAGGASGGGTAQGGGSGGTGGGANHTGGGTSHTGGGASGTGVFSLDAFAFAEPSVAWSSSGGFRVAFTAGVAPATVQYGECATNCGSAAGWQYATLYSGDQLTGRAKVAVGDDGRAHVIYSRGSGLYYAVCSQRCTTASNWETFHFSGALDGWQLEWRGTSLVVDTSGRVSFIIAAQDARVGIMTCPSNCMSAASWSNLTFTEGGRSSMVAQGTTLHFVTSTNERLVYWRCASGCDTQAGWTSTALNFTHDGNMPTALAVTPAGAVRIAYNQGVADASEPQRVRDQDNRLLVWGCDANCEVQSNYAGVIIGAVGAGSSGLSLAAAGTGIVVASVDNTTHLASVCENGCGERANWQSAALDDTTALNSERDPFAAAPCGTAMTRPLAASWYPENPAVALSSSGAALFVSGTHLLRQCTAASNSQRQAGYGRFIFSP